MIIEHTYSFGVALDTLKIIITQILAKNYVFFRIIIFYYYLICVCEIPAGMQGEFFDKLNKMTGGSVQTKQLK